MPSFTPVQSLFRSVAIGAVDQITFSGNGGRFRILNRGAVDLWARADSVDPAASTDGSTLIRSGEEFYLSDPGAAHDLRLTAGVASCLYGAELVA